MRVRDRAVKMEAGIREKNIFSNLIVKSKSPRQPLSTVGPKRMSSRHVEKSMASSHPSIVREAKKDGDGQEGFLNPGRRH